MKFKIDQFYYDDNYKVLKFKGYKDNMLLFERYEKSFIAYGKGSGWASTGQMVNIRADFQLKRFKVGKVKQIPPPQ